MKKEFKTIKLSEHFTLCELATGSIGIKNGTPLSPELC